jgi:tetratricopeptide (TPR) repeat protein
VEDSAGTAPTAQDISEPAPVPETRTPSVETGQPRNPAVIALLADAEQSRLQGDYRAAQNSLQRAQRIAPTDAQVYYDLARTHLSLEDFDLAEQVALKGVSLVQGNAVQLRRFWKLIARIRLQAGDAEGARQAENKADGY